jgi:hypothetical protein
LCIDIWSRPGEIIVTATTKPSEADSLRTNEKKWSKTLMDAGWTAIPSVIIERQAAFGLDSIDMNIIIHLAQYWWTPDRLLRIPMKPATHSKRKPATDSDLKPAGVPI